MSNVIDLYAHKTYLRYINSLYPKKESRADTFRDNAELIHAALGLAGESGEVVDIIKKHVAYGRNLDVKALFLELGDVFHYLCRIMELTGLELDDVRDGNMEKLKKRYPNGYNNYDAIQQKDKEEDNK